MSFREWHATFTPGEDELIQGVNQDFPTAVTYAIDSVLGEILLKHNEPMDMPMGANAPNTYVTGVKWAPEQGQRAGFCGGRTSHDRWARALRPREDTHPMPGP